MDYDYYSISFKKALGETGTYCVYTTTFLKDTLVYFVCKSKPGRLAFPGTKATSFSGPFPTRHPERDGGQGDKQERNLGAKEAQIKLGRPGNERRYHACGKVREIRNMVLPSE